MEIISIITGHDLQSQAYRLLEEIEASTPHFNKLTPAEAERLSLLLEECGEVVQIIGKIQRHGYESHNPKAKGEDAGEKNRERLERECGDVRHAMIRLCAAGDLDKDKIHAHADAKRLSIGKWLHHG